MWFFLCTFTLYYCGVCSASSIVRYTCRTDQGFCSPLHKRQCKTKSYLSPSLIFKICNFSVSKYCTARLTWLLCIYFDQYKSSGKVGDIAQPLKSQTEPFRLFYSWYWTSWRKSEHCCVLLEAAWTLPDYTKPSLSSNFLYFYIVSLSSVSVFMPIWALLMFDSGKNVAWTFSSCFFCIPWLWNVSCGQLVFCVHALSLNPLTESVCNLDVSIWRKSI